MKMNKRIYLYIITALVLPSIFQEALIRLGAVDEERKWLIYLILTASIIAVVLLAEFVMWIVYLCKTPSVETMLERIDRIGEKYVLFGETKMFNVPNSEFDMFYAKNVKNTESIFRNARPHTVYHSLSAKKHLSWVEFIFWDFLRDLKEELGFNVMIAFHEDEKGRESGENTGSERYKEMCREFAQIARNLIGKDIKIINEEEYLKRHPRLYCDFHKVYVEKLLESAKLVAEGKSDYKGFCRGLSFAESVFPLIAAAKKHDRIYAIDRETAFNIWNSPPLDTIKKEESIYFILAETLKDPDNNPLQIFTADGTLNITDDPETVRKKLLGMPEITRQIMYNIISTNTPYTPSVEGFDDVDTVYECIMFIKNKYAI